MQEQPNYTEEGDIDPRKVLQNLWNARLFIIGITIIATFVAFAVSTWVLPRKYQAIAYIYVGQSAMTTNPTTYFSIIPKIPDINSAAKLAIAPELLANALGDPDVVAAQGNSKLTLGAFSSSVTAGLEGKDLISLKVDNTNPALAASLANALAKNVVSTLNSTYTVGDVSNFLNNQVSQSQKDYEQAQAALEEGLSKSQAGAITTQRDAKKAQLAKVLDGVTRDQSVLADLDTFGKSLASLPGESPISLGDGLVLTALRQRSLNSNSSSNENYTPGDNITFQVDAATFSGVTVANALETVAQMKSTVQLQLASLQDEQKQLELDIPQLESNLENSSAVVTRLTTNRDQSLNLYNDLLQQKRLAAVQTQAGSNVANISAKAVTPDKITSPNALLNTGLTGIITLFLSILGVILVDWWRGVMNTPSKKA